MPEIVPVPSPLSLKLRPLGRAPVLERAAAGEPVVETVNDFATPVVKVTELALVKAGAVPGLLTVKVKDCEALPAPEVALIVRG